MSLGINNSLALDTCCQQNLWLIRVIGGGILFGEISEKNDSIFAIPGFPYLGFIDFQVILNYSEYVVLQIKFI